MTKLWVVFGLMALVAIGFAVWPLLRRRANLSTLVLGLVVWVVALSAGLYAYQGSPGVPSGSGQPASLDEAVAALAARLEQTPDDADGWMMLGRSYMSLGDFPAAVEAFQAVVDLQPQNAHALVSLGESKLASANTAIDGEIAAHFENALAIDPNNPQALFYGGIGAFNRNDKQVAADRWERLLALNPPPEIQGILRQRIAEWRGEPVPTMPPQHPPVAEPQPANGAVVAANVAVSAEAKAALPENATVFVIARDPAQPSPPIAVTRRRLSELPATVALGDRESMIPGRTLSNFAEFELVARVSMTGQPAQQSGDWYGAAMVQSANNDVIDLVIDKQVP